MTTYTPSTLQSLLLGTARLFFGRKRAKKLEHAMLYNKQRAEWLAKGGKITRTRRILKDYADTAGAATGHYFHQDLLVAKLIHDAKPKRHIDIGSRVDGFVAHVASFRPIEVLDVRPLTRSVHENITFTQADLMFPQDIGQTDSLSCLHAIEHFGLGRYTDPIDVEGHTKGIANLVDLVAPGGRLYISFPIGLADEVHFNAHRVFHPESIFAHPSIAAHMTLTRFDYVDDAGDLHLDRSVSDAVGKARYGCGIYTFYEGTVTCGPQAGMKYTFRLYLSNLTLL
ncbi:DUF268 domain-containing protein [Aestuariivita boseongensis]|uniref:DUF268 domain-containing protein n=1 Tax=Aestuariivita boseongensis TaxID=1470562 RepID=UPI0006814B04|nr:DUF268 domain-containing protein [Aestuariivita boseongensis]